MTESGVRQFPAARSEMKESTLCQEKSLFSVTMKVHWAELVSQGKYKAIHSIYSFACEALPKFFS